MTRKLSFHSCMFAAIALLGTTLLTGCKQEDSTPAPEVSVEAAPFAVGTISEMIHVDGVLSPQAQAAIQPKFTAPVDHFDVQRGDHVRSGQLLLTLENQDLAAAAQENQGALATAQANYETAMESSVPEEFTRSRLELKQAEADYNLNESIVNAREKLFQEGAIPGRDLDTAKTALLQAKATLDLAKAHYQALEATTHKAAIEAVKGELASAKGKYLGAQAQLTFSEIRSPIDGYVTDRPLFDGETAQAGSPVITVMDTSVLIAKLHLAQAQALQLKIGSPGEITTPGSDAKYPGKVVLISPALDAGSSTIEVWFRVENSKQELKAGTPVHVSLTGRTVDNATLIPKMALQTSPDGTHFVMIVDAKNTAQKRPVTVGIVSDDEAQLLSGLRPEDKVIASGSYALDAGTPVKIGAATTDATDGDKQ